MNAVANFALGIDPSARGDRFELMKKKPLNTNLLHNSNVVAGAAVSGVLGANPVSPSGAGLANKITVALDLLSLFSSKKEISADPPDKRYRIRQDQSIPILEKIKAWLEDLQPNVVPKSLLGKAINYALEQWHAVSRYVEDGNLAIDNNIAEREIKPFVIGRKNWLFADSVDGAYANAVMYSLVNTAKANGIDPFKYLCHLFERMPYANTVNDIRSLCPWIPGVTIRQSLLVA